MSLLRRSGSYGSMTSHHGRRDDDDGGMGMSMGGGGNVGGTSVRSPSPIISSPTHNHDEYTDYSCSTSVERLSRDIETLLRSWHLDGSDRHVSFVVVPGSSAGMASAGGGGGSAGVASARRKHHFLHPSQSDSSLKTATTTDDDDDYDNHHHDNNDNDNKNNNDKCHGIITTSNTTTTTTRTTRTTTKQPQQQQQQQRDVVDADAKNAPDNDNGTDWNGNGNGDGEDMERRLHKGAMKALLASPLRRVAITTAAAPTTPPPSSSSSSLHPPRDPNPDHDQHHANIGIGSTHSTPTHERRLRHDFMGSIEGFEASTRIIAAVPTTTMAAATPPPPAGKGMGGGAAAGGIGDASSHGSLSPWSTLSVSHGHEATTSRQLLRPFHSAQRQSHNHHHHHQQQQQQQSQLQPRHRRNSSGTALLPSSAADLRTSAAAAAAPPSIALSEVRLIRSASVTWTVPLQHHQHHQHEEGGVASSSSKVDIPLVLSIWDGPSRLDDAHDHDNYHRHHDAIGTAELEPDDDPNAPPPPAAADPFVTPKRRPGSSASPPPSSSSPSSHLPASMRRLPFHKMPLDPFVNFSALFGIGQHITLSHDLTTSTDREAFAKNLGMVVRSVGGDIVGRHRDDGNHAADGDVAMMMASWRVAASLAASLQTALNCAAANSDCRIPCVAVWGVYNPSPLEEAPWLSLNRRHSSVVLDDGGGRRGNGGGGGGGGFGRNALLYPPWLSFPNPKNLPRTQSHRHLFQRTPILFQHEGRAPPSNNSNNNGGGGGGGSNHNHNQYLPPIVSSTLVSRQDGPDDEEDDDGEEDDHQDDEDDRDRDGQQQQQQQQQVEEMSTNTGRTPSERSCRGHLRRRPRRRRLRRRPRPLQRRHSFSVSLLPFHSSPATSRLTLWAQLLLDHSSRASPSMSAPVFSSPFASSSSSSSSLLQDDASSLHSGQTQGRHKCRDPRTVVLCGAKHVYRWNKPQIRFPRLARLLFGVHSDVVAWRQSSEHAAIAASDARNRRRHHHHHRHSEEEEEEEDPAESMASYRDECGRYALSLLEKAFGASPNEPLWGPPDDPIASTTATVTWKGTKPPAAAAAVDDRSGFVSSPCAERDAGEHSNNNGSFHSFGGGGGGDGSATTSAPPGLPPQYPLITFPLKVRSRKAMSRSDWIDMEDTVERTMLDPLGNAADFVVQVQFDHDTSVSTLAAQLRLLLAGLIRTATLPPAILLQHLTYESIMEEWNVDETEAAASHIMQRANVGHITRRLVGAMDWKTIADEMMEADEARDLVEKLMEEGVHSHLGFPSPPEGIFAATMTAASDLPEEADETDAAHHPLSSSAAPSYQTPSSLPFLNKSAPPGRLLSMLFTRMSRLRSPSSMALVWLSFVDELRHRWDKRESLCNMSYVPGIDPDPETQSKNNRSFSTIGRKADYAAFVNTSEPDPDDLHCLVGQKLQVFNLGIECAVAMEIRASELMEQRNSLHAGNGAGADKKAADDDAADGGNPPSVASTEVVNNAAGQSRSDEQEASPSPTHQTPIVDTIPHHSFGAIREHDNDDDDEVSSSGVATTSRMEYYDALEANSFMMMLPPKPFAVMNMIASGDYTTNVAHRQIRRGARCPVLGVSLIASGDQLYAPYLQRPYPLTDDVILERRAMLTRRWRHKPDEEDSDAAHHDRIQQRVEVALRLQKPKLLSDMKAFKAANPGSIFQDFVAWYGNPENPLDDYMNEESLLQAVGAGVGAESSGSASRGGDLVDKVASVAMKLDRASEAIAILTKTRDFWSGTWDEAEACSAHDQSPLFDISSTVEMLLDNLDTMHPASLLNQVLAVNLSMAYFALRTSAGEALEVSVVSKSFDRLRSLATHALDLLARDAARGTLFQGDEPKDVPTATAATPGNAAAAAAAAAADRLPNHASLESIRACEVACDALAETETVLSRCKSLLHKFPGQHDLIHSILRRADSDTIPLASIEGRKGLLAIIQQQQQRGQWTMKAGAGNGFVPVPCLREYIFRNTDETRPSQLVVRFGQGGGGRVGNSGNNPDGDNEDDNGPHEKEEGGLMVALTTTI